MCGIIGYIGKKNVTPILLDGLHSLEYRGYDSAGIALQHEKKISVIKEKGKVDKLEALVEKKSKTAHAFGNCCNNQKKIEGDFTILDDVYEKYIFGFAMENCNIKGYITEKILNIYNAGAIPIFWGDSKSAEFFFNKKSYIDINDFNSLEEASNYIYNLSFDKEKLKEIKNKQAFKDPKLFQDLDYCFEKLKRN